MTDAELLAAVASRLLLLQAACRLVRRSKRRVAAAIARGEIPAVRLGRYTLLPRRAVLAWRDRTTERTRTD